MKTTTKRKSIHRRAATLTTDGPHTIVQCVQQYRSMKTAADQWLVCIAQHIALHRLNRIEIQEMLLDPKISRYHAMTPAAAYTCAGRLFRLSKNEDALLELKYGLAAYGKRMTITKQPF